MKLSNTMLMLPLALLLTGCEGYRYPRLSPEPQEMSSQTLCYRHATSQGDQALADEIATRGIDCAEIVKDDPLLEGQRR